MNRIINLFLAMAFLLALTACGSSANIGTESNAETPSPAGGHQNGVATSKTEAPEILMPETAVTSDTIITLTIGEQTFSATLLDNETTRQLIEQFPMTLDMSELNGNEKFFYMDSELITDSQRPGQINAGDLMLYGNNCLVLFYDTFSSSYSYTRLGSVNDPSGLADALGAGSVTITFSIED